MAELLCVTNSVFIDEMQKAYGSDEQVTSLHVFDTFVKGLSIETNVLSEDKLKGLVFRQFKSYGDDDETMAAVAENVSDIKQSTQDALTAIDKQDTSGLKKAYAQLKNYEKRILELEEDIYTDDLTGVNNRKYLTNHDLDKEGTFKANGSLLQFSINNFNQINKEHGHETGDSVLKFVAKMCQKELSSVAIHLVRYLGVHFVAVAKESVASKAITLSQRKVDAIVSKKFKTHNGEVLNIELELNTVDISKAEGFEDAYKKF